MLTVRYSSFETDVQVITETLNEHLQILRKLDAKTEALPAKS